jgi:hypothetical protein
MLSHGKPRQPLPGEQARNADVPLEVRTSVEADIQAIAATTCFSCVTHRTVCGGQQPPDVTAQDMAMTTERLECPLCDFTVLPSDDYVLRLHFEQLHTTDSPFIIEDDPEPLPPPLPARSSSTRSDQGSEHDTTAEDLEGSVYCPAPDCGELVSLIDFNDHLDYHAAESLSFDEATGQYVYNARCLLVSRQRLFPYPWSIN